MKKFFTLICLAIICSFKTFAQDTITTYQPYGMGACVGGTATLYDSDSSGTGTSGTWSSSNIAVATIGVSTGVVTAISAGTTTISYVVGSTVRTTTFYVTAVPAPITGAATLCVPDTLILSDATTGGTWAGVGGYAFVNYTDGMVIGVYGGGTEEVDYIAGPGCYVSASVSVNAAPTPAIDGPGNVCVGSTISITDSAATGTGTWSSSNTAIATVSSTGLVTGVSDGTVIISYAESNSCGTGYGTLLVVVGPVSPGTISVASSIVAGSSTTPYVYGLYGSSGGSWSISPTTVATINPASGVITGIAAGTAVISYNVASCGATVVTTADITVTAFNGISGYITFDSGAYYGDVKVWLITYNPSTLMLEAIDSQIVYCTDSSVYYQFTGEPTDSFRVKAAVSDSAGVLVTGPLPTYATSNFYWSDAFAVLYTSGSPLTNYNINMLYGSTTGGPGFIGGNVTTGANRSTAGGSGIPVAGLNIVAINTVTNVIAGMVSTDASGNYSFSSLPYGTYTIFPDSLNYGTVPYSEITVSATTPTVTGAGFIQHTISNTITPNPTAVANLTATATAISVFPNPTSGKVNIQWASKATEKATVTVADITGREVYGSSISLAQGSGTSSIDLSELVNGIYIISVKSASVDYTNKIELMH